MDFRLLKAYVLLFWPKINSLSFTLTPKCLFYLHLYTYYRKSGNPSPSQVCDVIYVTESWGEQNHKRSILVYKVQVSFLNFLPLDLKFPVYEDISNCF